MPFRKIAYFDSSRVTVISVFLSILIAIVVLIGWTFHLELLKNFNTSSPSIKVNTAIGVLFSGISLLLYIRKKNMAALLLATIVFLLGVVSLGEHLFHFNAYIDELFFFDKGTVNDNHHGRMPFLTCVAAIMTSISLLFYSSKRKLSLRVSEFFAILVLILSLAGFIGSLYNAGQSFRAANVASFSLPTALTGLLISIAILFSRPGIGYLSVFYKQTAAAKTGIKGILINITILVGIGWFCLKGQDRGVFDKEMGLVIMITTFTISFLFIARSGIKLLNRSEDRLTDSEKNLRHVLSSTDDVFYVVDKNYHITLINETAEKNLTKFWGKKVSLGDNLLDLLPDEKFELIQQSFRKCFEGNKIEYEIQNSFHDLPEWVLVNYNPVINNDGTVIGAYIVSKDISERKKAEETLKKSEERYRSIIEQASDAIMITDQKGAFIDVNSSFCSLFGYSKKELMSMNVRDVIDPEHLKTSPLQFDVLLAGETVVRERIMMHKNRTLIEVEANVKMLPDGRMMAVARNITDRKKTEAKLIEQERLLRLFVEDSPASLAMFDNDMCYIIASRRWIKDYNLGDQLLTGKSHYEIFPEIQQNWKDIHLRCLSGAIEKKEEDAFIRADGSVEWIRWEIHPWHKASGHVGGIIMFTEVITDRKGAEDALKESEERYKALVENAPEALVVFDVEKEKFVSVSESATRLFGMSKAELLKIGPSNISPKNQPDGRLSSEAIIKNIKEAVEGNKPIFEWVHCDVSGNPIPCEVWLVRLPSERNVLIRGSIFDITERKKVQDALEKSYKEIRQLTEHLQNIREEERISIAREIHDELGQQLTVLKMDIAWLSKKFDDSDSEVMQKINGLLDLSDATINSVRKISAELRPSLLDDLGLEATMEWQLKEFEKHSGISTTFAVVEMGMILPDKFKTGLFRIFQESLTNVARHAEATNVKVSLLYTNGKIILSIEDDGKGFDKKKTFNKRTLGILGMKERTEMMGGEYEITSSPNKGTTVIVAIPEQDL